MSDPLIHDLSSGARLPGYVDRESLINAGGGAAQAALEPADVVPYTRLIAQRLAWVEPVLRHQMGIDRLSRAAYRAAAGLADRIAQTMGVMALKHGRHLIGADPLPLTVDPTGSGFPTFKDFWTLADEVGHATERLATIPTEDALYAAALDAIFRGVAPAAQQARLLERGYLEQLQGKRVVEDCSVHAAVDGALPSGEAGRAWSYDRLVHSLNRFDSVTVHHATGSPEPDPARIQAVVGAQGMARPELLTLLGALTGLGMVPVMIERVHLGPLYHRWTQNDERIRQVFDALHDEPFLMRITIERALIARTPGRARLGGLLGSEPDTYRIGALGQERLLVVPVAAKQLLGDADEDGQPAHVYGLSRGGDLVY